MVQLIGLTLRRVPVAGSQVEPRIRERNAVALSAYSLRRTTCVKASHERLISGFEKAKVHLTAIALRSLRLHPGRRRARSLIVKRRNGKKRTK
jgi:hypothetical protein